MYYALNDNFAPIVFQQQQKAVSFGELMDDHQATLSEAAKLLREAAIIESIAQRLLAGEVIDWDVEA